MFTNSHGLTSWLNSARITSNESLSRHSPMPAPTPELYMNTLFVILHALIASGFLGAVIGLRIYHWIRGRKEAELTQLNTWRML